MRRLLRRCRRRIDCASLHGAEGRRRPDRGAARPTTPRSRPRPLGPPAPSPRLLVNASPRGARRSLSILRSAAADPEMAARVTMNSSTRHDSTRRNGWCRRGYRRGYRWSAALGALSLAGCATFSGDGGFSDVAHTTQARLGKEVQWLRTPEERAEAQAQVAALMQRPLSVDEAVQIALLNNPGLQAAFQELVI